MAATKREARLQARGAIITHEVRAHARERGETVREKIVSRNAQWDASGNAATRQAARNRLAYARANFRVTVV